MRHVVKVKSKFRLVELLNNRPLLVIMTAFLFSILITSPLAIAEPNNPNFGTIHQNLPKETTFSNNINENRGPPEFIPNRYIVVFEDGVSPSDVIKAKGLAPDFVYTKAINGFAGFLNPVQLEDLKQDPRVSYVEQDKIARVSAQTLPTGIDRIDAEPVSPGISYAGDVTIAILDTGIDYFHIDLNVVKRYECLNALSFPWVFIECNEGSTSSDGIAIDNHGHGSHVAGTVAAKDNEYGPVGIVPGADLWAIKVLEDDGSGTYSQIIMGVEYVIDNAHLIDVANMSLGGPKDTALNQAVANAVDAGVVFVVAAGNEKTDASTRSPASEPKAITVSAYADFDGLPGGLSNDFQAFSSCTEDQDDSFACFSNYGSIVDISAPGVNIFSTYRDGLYHIASGTSMASPHVAGAAAKLISEGVSPNNVLTTLLSNGVDYGESGYLVIDDDPDNISETLLYVGNSNGEPILSDNDGDGYLSDVDCNDADATINPDATEVFDDVDNNCDGTIDEGFTDADNDGFAAELNDCNDADATINPDATEIPDNDVDENCDGVKETTGTSETHVGDVNWTASDKRNWNAKVFLTIYYDSDNSAVPGIFVEVDFNGDSLSCTTDNLGKCQFNKTTQLDSLTFAVVSLDTVDASTLNNNDPDGDFSGNDPSVIIYKGVSSQGSEGNDGGSDGSCNPGQQRKGLC